MLKLSSILFLLLVSAGSTAAKSTNSNNNGNAPLPETADEIAVKNAFGQKGISQSELKTTDQGVTSRGLRTVHVQQHLQGINVYNARGLGVVNSDGSVSGLEDTFEKNLNTCVNTRNPVLTQEQAVAAAAAYFGVTIGSLVTVTQATGSDKKKVFRGLNALSMESTIEVFLNFYIQEGTDCSIRLVWMVAVHPNDDNWGLLIVDAVSGVVIMLENWVTGASLTVFANREAPCKTCTDYDYSKANSFNVKSVDLNVPTTVPDSWLDGTKKTIGNNVHAGEDIAKKNAANPASATSGSYTFNYPVNLSNPTGSPSSSWKNAAIVNLFYWTNMMHDILYVYGFDEKAGNFQLNNFNRGGSGNDRLKAEAQDGGTANNANMATPPDGTSPRMQMGMWTGNLDSSFDTGVIAHEYCHGLSNRLTGGRTNTACLQNSEQAGEGWSDYCALFVTAKPDEVNKVMGAYVYNNVNGIRNRPYSRNMAINEVTYGQLNSNSGMSLSVPHGIGFQWASTLWDMTLGIMDYEEDNGRLRFNTNKTATTVGGNNIAFQIVVDALKVQVCKPNFIQSRNAILTVAANMDSTRGTNYKCVIWQAFARRGLGFSASSSTGTSSTSTINVKEAFDLPSECSTCANRFQFQMTTDKWATETSFTLVDSTGFNWFLSKGNRYQNGVIYTMTLDLCLPNDETFTFTIKDSYGDGICCSEGNGSYSISLDGVTLASGGAYGYENATIFDTFVGVVV